MSINHGEPILGTWRSLKESGAVLHRHWNNGAPDRSAMALSSAVSRDEMTLHLRIQLKDTTVATEILRVSADDSGLIARLAIVTESGDAELLAEMFCGRHQYQLRAPLALVARVGPLHDIVLRYTGSRIDLFIDGLILHQHGVARGDLYGAGDAFSLVSACSSSHEPREATLWLRALEDDQIIDLCGGQKRTSVVSGAVEEARAAETERAAAIAIRSPHRPTFHLMPPAFWVNDPNGLIAWKGKFHTFYQHNPFGPYWGTMHWGHAVSEDLVHWKSEPLALRPEIGTPDRDGCFSGCCVVTDEGPRIFYTGVYPEVQCMAQPLDDELRQWKKDAIPVITNPPFDAETSGFRDPWVWREADGSWAMIVGSGRRNRGGAIPLYRSKDLRHWRYHGTILESGDLSLGTVWECPFLFESNGRHVLIFSPESTGKVLAYVGTMRGDRFIPEAEPQELDLGRHFYAPHATRDAQGRWVMLAWVTEGRDQQASLEEKWACCLSLPRILEVDEDGQLRQRPLPELSRLRSEGTKLERLVVDSETRLLDIQGCELELQLTIERENAAQTVLELRRSTDGRHRVEVVVDWENNRLDVRRSDAGGDARCFTDDRGGTAHWPLGGSLELHVFLDRSVIEIFAGDGRTVLTTRAYPSLADSSGVGLRSVGGSARVSVQAWQLASIWPDSQVS